MRLLIEGAQVWDGTGAAPFPGKVLIDGERIAAVAPQSQDVAADGSERVDAKGQFLMPGMVEGHSHLSFVDVARGTALGARIRAYAGTANIGPLAIVATSNESYGRARLFAALADARRPLKIFRELHAARHWLDAQAPVT